ncbi:hypothetical protein HifGL_000367 [Haemophilus influenzae KR494]|nr:hypothetical protein HifGL_000367 [Haemophilus influenzae KR494]
MIKNCILMILKYDLQTKVRLKMIFFSAHTKQFGFCTYYTFF